MMVRNFVGGPLFGHVWHVSPHARVIMVTDGEARLGRYILTNLGWLWCLEPAP